jgi:large subunit ribosomal protein L15
LKISDLAPSRGAKKKEKRIGHGPGSGHGKTSTKGHKGQAARSGGTKAPGFEGGQQPLIRRVPKVGFINRFKKEFAVVNLSRLDVFGANEAVTPQRLVDVGIIKSVRERVKVLGNGEVAHPLVVSAHQFSQSARQKIEAAGGTVEVIQKS